MLFLLVHITLWTKLAQSDQDDKIKYCRKVNNEAIKTLIRIDNFLGPVVQS